jgi:hypothetical protein
MNVDPLKVCLIFVCIAVGALCIALVAALIGAITS